MEENTLECIAQIILSKSRNNNFYIFSLLLWNIKKTIVDGDAEEVQSADQDFLCLNTLNHIRDDRTRPEATNMKNKKKTSVRV